MAPEQLEGEPVTVAADVYAAGVMLFEMLAGAPPWPRGSLVELLHRKQAGAPPLTSVVPVLGLDAAVGRFARRGPFSVQRVRGDAAPPKPSAKRHFLRMSSSTDCSTHLVQAPRLVKLTWIWTSTIRLVISR